MKMFDSFIIPAFFVILHVNLYLLVNNKSKKSGLKCEFQNFHYLFLFS
jgi:hypothetical protein